MKLKLAAQQIEEINMYIKNGADISPLIADYSVKGENLSNAIIKTFDRPDEDISGLILTGATIGEEGKVTNLNRTIAKGCNFRQTTWKGDVWARRADFSGTSFHSAFLPYMDYRNADMRHCDFCGAVYQFATERGLGVKYSDEFFEELGRFWNVIILRREEYENLMKNKEA